MAQVSSVCNRPLLTVRDRQMPVLRHAEGTAGEGQPRSGVAAMVTSFTGGVRPVLGDHLPRWQGRQARGSWIEGVRTRRQTPTASQVDTVREGVLTWRLRTSRRGCSRKAFFILCG
jgi:hypothetical protein